MKRTMLVAVTVLVACAACVFVRAQQSPRGSEGKAMLENGVFTVQLNGHNLLYEVRGAGPVLMTLPNSWGLSHEGLRGLYAPLEKSFTMVYFDPRGMLGSRPMQKKEDMSMAAVREDFDALRRHLGLSKVAAIGWSNGAINMLLLASEKPETLSSAIILHGTDRQSQEDEAAMIKERPADYKRYMDFFARMEKARLYPESAAAKVKSFMVEEAFPSMCADPKAGRPKIEAAFKDAEFSWAHMKYSQEEMGAFDFRDRLGMITARCLVISGAHDLLPVERGRETAALIPGASFLLLEKSGHFGPLEEPGAFAEAVGAFMAHDGDEEAKILELERWALDRWGKGDPSGFLSICDPGVVYFDNTIERRLDGLPALTAYYEGVRGKVLVDGYELVNPKVQLLGEAAVLTFNYTGRSGERQSRWNCTEVYARTPQGWRIVQTHWSPTLGRPPA